MVSFTTSVRSWNALSQTFCDNPQSLQQMQGE